MNPGADADKALLEKLVLGQLSVTETEGLAAVYSQDERVAELAEALAPRQDRLIDALRQHQPAPPDADADRLAGRLVQKLRDSGAGLTVHGPFEERPLPETLEYFRILKVLGEGGMGTVYLADDTRLGRLVAVKTLKPALAQLPEARERFLREARSVAKLEHDYIVPIYYVGEADGTPFLVMPFLQGEPLNDRLLRLTTSGQLLPVADTIRIAWQVVTGLTQAHARGLIHRDIKPGNIWLEAPGERVRILDFGLARSQKDPDHLTASGMVVGTPAYMPPEQRAGGAVDERTDLFSFGCVLYEMLTGQLPFTGEETERMPTSKPVRAPAAPSAVNPSCPPALSRLTMQLLARNPTERPPSAAAVAAELARMAGPQAHGRVLPVSKDTDVRVGGVTVAIARPRQRRPAWLLAGLAVLGVLLLLALALVSPGKQRVIDSPLTKGPLAGNESTFTNSLGMKLVRISPGKFKMGSPQKEIERAILLDKSLVDLAPSEGPEHDVEITQAFYMGATEVTVRQFREFVSASKYDVGDNLWQAPEPAGDYPVASVSWQNAVDFCAWLSRKEGKNYRLPTEAEWEYCCRAGRARTRFGFGDDDEELDKHAWYQWNSGRKVHPVGTRAQNAWGLFDMHGNVWEWCQDKYAADYYQNSPPKDPPGPEVGDDRVIRGGAAAGQPVHCRCAIRRHHPPSDRRPNLGFRVVCEIPKPKQ